MGRAYHRPGQLILPLVLRTGILGLALLSVCGGAIRVARAQNQSTAQAAPTSPGQPPQDGGGPATLKRGELLTEGVTFSPKSGFEKGQQLRYAAQLILVLRIPGRTADRSDFVFSPTMDTVLRYGVRESKPGSQSILSVLSEGGRFANPQGGFDRLAREPESASRTLTLDALSRLIAFKEPPGKKANSSLDSLFNDANLIIPLQILPLPDKPIRVGESWIAQYAVPGKSGGNEGEQGTNTSVKATLTLLGTEKLGDVPTTKLKQVLTVPFTSYTDGQGKPTSTRGAKGKMQMTLTFTQIVNALPETGLLVRSEGTVKGEIRFEGALLAQLPGNLMTISGNLIVLRVDDTAPPDSSK